MSKVSRMKKIKKSRDRVSKVKIQPAVRELTWKEAKIWAMVVCGYHCQKCGEKKEGCELEAHHREFYPEDEYIFSTTEDIFKVMRIFCYSCHDLVHFIAWRIVKGIEKKYPLTKKKMIDKVTRKTEISLSDVEYVLEEFEDMGLTEKTKEEIYLTQKGEVLCPRIKRARKFIRRLKVK